MHTILHVIPTLDQSGAEKQLALLAAHLPRQKFQLHVCALTRGGPYQSFLESAGVEVTVIGKRLSWDPWALWKLRELVRRVNPDLVQTWLFAGNCYGRAAAILSGTRRIVASERCVDSWKRKYQFAIDRWLAGRTDRVVTNTQAVRVFYEKVGIPSDKFVVIPNAVPPAPPTIEPTPRAALGIPEDAPIVAFIGRLWPQKRVHDLIWAADILRVGGLDLHVLIIGDGPRRVALERFTRNIELEHRVHFLGQRTDAASLLRTADLLVLPSVFEGMPNVVLEAMQAGKAVVATRIPGMDELVVDGETGVLVEAKKPFGVARAVRELLLDSSRREAMGEAGKRRVAELFSVERMVDSYARLYEELLVGRTDRPLQ